MLVPKRKPPQEDVEAANETTGLLSKPRSEIERWFHMPQWVFLTVFSLTLIGIGAFIVKHIEEWRFLTSLYVIVQIVTTIGYGDFTVTSDTMKLFCSFYVLIALTVLSYALNLLVISLHNASMETMREYLRTFEANYMSHADLITRNTSRRKLEKKMKQEYGQRNELVVAAFFCLMAVAFGTVFYATYESCTCSYGRSFIDGCNNDTEETCIATGGYKKSWISAFYMSVITLTTVGFGDHTPRSEVGRAVGIVWMLLGVVATGNFLVCLTEVFLQEDKKLKISRTVSRKIFEKMDKDGDGTINRAEFRGYFLVKNRLVSQEDLDLIDQHYDSLEGAAKNAVTWETLQKHHDGD